jgi:hypothetical protein
MTDSGHHILKPGAGKGRLPTVKVFYFGLPLNKASTRWASPPRV